MCVRHGADILGFVVDYPQETPWNVRAESAKELMKAVSEAAETCIVTGGAPAKVLNLALKIKPNYVQLHCGETLEDTVYISDKLGKHGIKVIKTLFPQMPDLEKAAKDFSTAGVYALLLDPRTPDNAVAGGAVNLSAYKKLRCAVNCPVILAGGINSENVKEVVFQTEAPIIDLMTGVEHLPGLKDAAKVLAFFQSLRECGKPFRAL